MAGGADTLVAAAEWPEPTPPEHDVYKLPLSQISWLPAPRPIDNTVRAKLEAFEGKSPDANPGWLVQTTSRLSAHDFEVVTAGDVA
jgi:hypothetical protein